MDIWGMYDRLLEHAGKALDHLQRGGGNVGLARMTLEQVVTADGKYIPRYVPDDAAPVPPKAPSVVALDRESIQGYLDTAIASWRHQRDRTTNSDDRLQAVCYVDAFQSVRASLLGDVLPHPDDDEGATDERQSELPKPSIDIGMVSATMQRQSRRAERDRIIEELRNHDHGPHALRDPWVKGWEAALEHVDGMDADDAQPFVMLSVAEAKEVGEYLDGGDYEPALIDSAKQKIRTMVAMIPRVDDEEWTSPGARDD